MKWLGYSLMALCAAGAQAQGTGDTVVVKRPAELRETPATTARSVAALPVQTPLTRLERQGPWVQVRTAQGQNGWVHMFDVGLSGGASTGGNIATGALRNITNLFGRSNPQGQTQLATSTLGIRGLGAADLNNAQPNVAAVSLVEGMRVDAGQARAFAGEAGLATQQVEALPAPAAARAAPAPGGMGGTPGNPGMLP
jgi:hypothetical protein